MFARFVHFVVGAPPLNPETPNNFLRALVGFLYMGSTLPSRGVELKLKLRIKFALLTGFMAPKGLQTHGIITERPDRHVADKNVIYTRAGLTCSFASYHAPPPANQPRK